jgi:hypothetical protein
MGRDYNEEVELEFGMCRPSAAERGGLGVSNSWRFAERVS